MDGEHRQPRRSKRLDHQARAFVELEPAGVDRLENAIFDPALPRLA